MTNKRQAATQRVTQETDIKVQLDIDGQGQSDITTGVPFLTHMLDLLAKHGKMDLTVKADGDTAIDDHHTTEDIAICLGSVLQEALGDKKGIHRYGDAMVPMDESLAQVVVDLSHRPYFVDHTAFPAAKVGTFDVELVSEFLHKLAVEARMNLHVLTHYGTNTHHLIEAVFKALGRALDEATLYDERVVGIPSTKGTLS